MVERERETQAMPFIQKRKRMRNTDMILLADNKLWILKKKKNEEQVITDGDLGTFLDLL